MHVNGWPKGLDVTSGGSGIVSQAGLVLLRSLADKTGLTAVPTAWRTLSEIASRGPRAQARITRAVNAARRQAWAGIQARHGAIPGVADRRHPPRACPR